MSAVTGLRRGCWAVPLAGLLAATTTGFAQAEDADRLIIAPEGTADDEPGPATTPPVRFEADNLQSEPLGYLPDDGTDVDTQQYLRLEAALAGNLGDRWRWRAGGRVYGFRQTGDPDFRDADFTPAESYLRFAGDDVRITAGYQTVIWGRVDEIPPSDGVSVPDLRRFFLDELPYRRVPTPALRVEAFQEDGKWDLMMLPDFQAAELPDENSIWSPIDRQRGQIIGFPRIPALAPLIRQGGFSRDEPDGVAGAGVRYSRTGAGTDFGVTVQRVRRATPYFALSDRARRALSAGGVQAALAAPGPVFERFHPWGWHLGADIVLAQPRATWRLEAAYRTDVPVTRPDLRVAEAEALDWALEYEFFPGDGDARVNLQLVGHHLVDEGSVLDRSDVYNLNGELESTFAHGRWRAQLRYNVGLKEDDLFANPEIAYLGMEPHELYLGAHLFSGEAATPGGFHENHDFIVLGWRAQY